MTALQLQADWTSGTLTFGLMVDRWNPLPDVLAIRGDRVAVDRLLEHPNIKAISFVGSTPVAKSIYETATRNDKRVQALGGAKNHMLVLPDADIGVAADAARPWISASALNSVLRKFTNVN